MASKLMRAQRRARPWHERFRVLGWFRNRFRSVLFWLARGLAATDDGCDLLAQALGGVCAGRACRPDGLGSETAPYPDLGAAATPTGVTGAGTLFITGRFRSGSTLLWNLFRHVHGFTAYYEPYNERRWFDPAARGHGTDPSHRHVTDYWAEYEGLGDLGHYYREEWTSRNLFMDENAWDADLLAYTRRLVAKAVGRAALQCNRIDFRLPWFRHHFPAARVVHLYRHPRDQWCSALMDSPFPPGGTVAQFHAHDRFYLLSWARDLKHHFPFLDERTAEHPYQLFYYLWKLSYLFGRRYAHHSLSMEALVERPEVVLLELFRAVDVDPAAQDMQKLRALVVRPDLGKWKGYAGGDWFRRHEAACEAVLADFLRPSQERSGCKRLPVALERLIPLPLPAR